NPVAESWPYSMLRSEPALLNVTFAVCTGRTFMKRRLVGLMFAVLAAGSLAIEPAIAQTTSGQISGRVVDPDGQPIPGAEVTLTNQLTKDQRVQNTETSGDFVFASVQPGTFSITVTAPAFKTLTKQ